jgi:endoplasmic reticulum chaperone BiP
VAPLQDKLVKGKIDARNQLETYCYNIKSNVEDKMKDKLSDEDRKAAKEAVDEALEWLEENQDAEADEYKDKLKDVEDVVNPIMAKVYQQAGGEPGAAGPGGDDDLGDHDEL